MLESNDVVWGWIEPVHIKRRSSGRWAVQDYGNPLPFEVGDIGRNLAYLLNQVMGASNYTEKLIRFQRQVQFYNLDQVNSAIRHWSLTVKLPELMYASPVVNTRSNYKPMDKWE